MIVLDLGPRGELDIFAVTARLLVTGGRYIMGLWRVRDILVRVENKNKSLESR